MTSAQLATIQANRAARGQAPLRIDDAGPRRGHAGGMAQTSTPGPRRSTAKRNTGRKMEKDIQQEIEDWLVSLGKECWFVRQFMFTATTQRPGVPDFQIVHRGMFYGIEVKRPGQKPKPHQLGELRWIEHAGGRAGIAHSLDEVKMMLGFPID